jgi:hypothetical protein
MAAPYSLDQLVAVAGGADATLRIGGAGAAERVDAGRAALGDSYCDTVDPESWSPIEVAKSLFCGLASLGASAGAASVEVVDQVGGAAVEVVDKVTDPAEAAYAAVGDLGTAAVDAAGAVWLRGQDLAGQAIDTVDKAVEGITNPLGLGAVSFGAVGAALVVGGLVAAGADLAFNGGAGARSLLGLRGRRR